MFLGCSVGKKVPVPAGGEWCSGGSGGREKGWKVGRFTTGTPGEKTLTAQITEERIEEASRLP
jgi:hypothetical protein